eukprot:3163656-Lingulodinium_polyedra.AAC.1
MVPYPTAAGKGPHLWAVIHDVIVRLGGLELGQQPGVVLQSGHEAAVGANVAQVNALGQLRAPVGGLRKHLVSEGTEGGQNRD